MTTTPVVDDETILAQAKKHWRLTEQAEAPWRRRCLEDWAFYSGEQWEEKAQKWRESKGKPCITINDLPPVVRQAVNNILHDPPQIKVAPVESSDVETAEVHQGLIRQIEVYCGSKVAYQIAMEHMVVMGFGCWYVDLEWADDAESRLRIVVRPEMDPFSVLIDHTAQLPDASDAKYCFHKSMMTRDAYKEQFGEDGIGGSALDAEGTDKCWEETEDTVQVVKYWRVHETPVYHGTMTDGEPFSDLTLTDEERDKLIAAGVVLNRRMRKSVCCYLLSNERVLERTEWPDKRLPYVRIIARDSRIDGKRDIKGLVRDVKELSRMVNYMGSSLIEMTALAKSPPWLIAAGQLEGFEKYWDSANQENWTHLPYNPISIDGTPVPPPSRNFAEPPVQAISQAIMYFGQAKREAHGFNTASLGQSGPEHSGKAILARQREGDEANAHWAAALANGVALTGKIILGLVQKIYTEPQIMRILGPDGQEKAIAVNGMKHPEFSKVFDLTAGEFDIVVSSGPSWETQRQQKTAQMIDLTKAMPIVAQVAPDMVVREMDIPGADGISKRIQKALPPGLQDPPEGAPPPLPPEVMQRMQQMDQTIQVMTKMIEDQAKTIEGKTVESESKERIAAAKNESDQEIAKLKAEVELLTAAAKIDAQKATEEIWVEMEAIKAHLAEQRAVIDRLHEQRLEAARAGHERGMAAEKTAQSQNGA